MNGDPAANVSISQTADRTWALNWDTTHLPNGTYTIQVAFQFNPGGTSNFVYEAQKVVSIYNPITFAPLSSKFADFLLINATLAMTNANYTVEVYDDYGNPLVYASGATTNGQIQLYWDLTDGNGDKQDKHQFKLVVLNGCEAYDSLWAGAFGIDFSSQMSTNIVLDYQFTGRMPRAFVAWTKEVLVPNGADFSGLTHAEGV